MPSRNVIRSYAAVPERLGLRMVTFLLYWKTKVAGIRVSREDRLQGKGRINTELPPDTLRLLEVVSGSSWSSVQSLEALFIIPPFSNKH